MHLRGCVEARPGKGGEREMRVSNEVGTEGERRYLVSYVLPPRYSAYLRWFATKQVGYLGLVTLAHKCSLGRWVALVAAYERLDSQ